MVAGAKKLNKFRNQTMREWLVIEQLCGKLRETRLRWFGQIEKRDESYVRKRVRNMQVCK